MNLDLISNFLTLTDENLNLKKAAQKLYITQSTLSRQMTNLEQQLGVALFIRDGHSLRLTEVGAVLREQAPALLRHAATLGDRLLEASDGQSQDLLVSSFTLTERVFLKGVANFRLTHSDVNLKITPAEPDHGLDLLMTHACDLALATDIALRQLSQEAQDSLTSRFISATSACVVVNPSHPLAAMKAVTLKDLSGERIVTVDDPSANREMLREFRRVHFTPLELIVADSRTLRYNVNQMNSVAILFDNVITDILDVYTSVPLQGCDLGTELRLVAHKSHSDLVEDFLNCYR